jgi:glycosyltransferase involved in cell wall biosynthesis
MKVSVIVTTYNTGHLLPRAINSIKHQTHQDLEIFIVDDASTDTTTQVAMKLIEQDPRIRFKQLETNSGGAAKPKNVALALTTGTYIATLDADDEWLPEKLEKQIKLMDTSPEVGFVGCHEWIVNENNQEKKYHVPNVPNVLSRILESDYMGGGSCMMYRREVFDHLGGFDERLKSGQDWEMRIRLAQQYPFKIVEGEPLIKRYLHQQNIGKMDMQEKRKDVELIEHIYQQLYNEHPRIYSNKLRYDGTRFLLAGYRIDAWKSFIKSLRHNPLNLKTYLFFFISLFGQSIYRRLTELKRVLKNDLS